MREPLFVLLQFFNTEPSLIPLAVDWDQFVDSEAFNRQCYNAQSKRWSFNSSGPESNNHHLPWDGKSDIFASVDSSDHSVSKYEAYLYYHGLRGFGKLGPKLVYRTSTDVFPPPSGPFQDVRAHCS